ncbi:hypothetical protein [Novosphingobium sp. BL-52-GroH]|uniref:hypothetical protein n=1 Tax=Novosphingobium sp. BL-52-GroH TaxID=3349877 RepID=UPI00384E50C1
MFGSATPNSLGLKGAGIKSAVSVTALGISLALAAPALAQSVVNPGFETGDASGWVLSGGTWTSTAVWPPVDSTWAGAPNSVTITNAGDVDPFTGTPTVFAGNHAIRLNDFTPNYGVTALAQTVNGYAGNKLYYAWNAVLEPSHGPTDSPSFIIKVVDKTTGKVINNIAYSAYTAQNTTIFRTAGRYVTSDWKVEDIDMIAGHDYDLLFVALDCPYGAHSGYVYVDGFGNAIPGANANVDFDPLTDITRGSDVLIPIPGGNTPDIDLAKSFYTTTELTDGDVNPNFVGGTLQSDTGAAISTALTVQTQGGTIDTNGFDVDLTGGLTGAGGMTKVGEGTLTLSNAISTINEGFAVNAGTLAVNSALSSLNVTVGSGATLGGTGTIVADVAVGSGGTLAPGNSPGTLVVAAGDVTLADDATFAVEIDGRTYDAAGGAGTYDRLALTTGATFEPNGVVAPTLRGITGGNNTFTPVVGDTFTVVEGGAVGTGAFEFGHPAHVGTGGEHALRRDLSPDQRHAGDDSDQLRDVRHGQRLEAQRNLGRGRARSLPSGSGRPHGCVPAALRRALRVQRRTARLCLLADQRRNPCRYAADGAGFGAGRQPDRAHRRAGALGLPACGPDARPVHRAGS